MNLIKIEEEYKYIKIFRMIMANIVDFQGWCNVLADNSKCLELVTYLTP